MLPIHSTQLKQAWSILTPFKALAGHKPHRFEGPSPKSIFQPFVYFHLPGIAGFLMKMLIQLSGYTRIPIGEQKGKQKSVQLNADPYSNWQNTLTFKYNFDIFSYNLIKLENIFIKLNG